MSGKLVFFSLVCALALVLIFSYGHQEGGPGVRLSDLGAQSPNRAECEGTPENIEEWRNCQAQRNARKPKSKPVTAPIDCDSPPSSDMERRICEARARLAKAKAKCTQAEWRNAPYTLEIEIAFFSDPEQYMRTWRCKGEIQQVPMHHNRTGRDRSDAQQINRCLMHLRKRGAVGDVLTAEEAMAAVRRC